MLSQSFKSAQDLELSEKEYDALKQTLILLETDEVTHVRLSPTQKGHFIARPQYQGKFNMAFWAADVDDCGTVACICGTAEMIGNVNLRFNNNVALQTLFNPTNSGALLQEITTVQAAQALRSYLTTGQANWSSINAKFR